MPPIVLGVLPDIKQARYVVQLSDGRRLVLFRLPSIEPNKAARNAAANESDDGWCYFAMEAECPHAGGPMEESQVDIEDSGYIATCPWHAYDFNIDTGESSLGIRTCTFPILIHGSAIVLQYPSDQEVSLVKVDPVAETFKFKRTADDNGQGADASTGAIPRYLGPDATLCDWAVRILNCSNPEGKVELTAYLFSTFVERESSSPMTLNSGSVTPPSRPPREGLKSVEPWLMPKPGRGGTLKSRIAMLHALANIELWAIDLAVDICVRFSTFQTTTPSLASGVSRSLPRTFFHDWLKVAADEAKHFSLLRNRLEELGSSFGELPVHHGLWDSALATAHDLRARICIICLVHEARGLDVNPMTISKFQKAGDDESVKALNVIHQDEITHVTTGHRWLTWICNEEGIDAIQVFRTNVVKYFRGALKGPFNDEARMKAGMDPRFYDSLWCR